MKPTQQPDPLDEALVAHAAEVAIQSVTTAHTGETRLRALQVLAQHISAEVQTLAAELMAAKGAAARRARGELASSHPLPARPE